MYSVRKITTTLFNEFISYTTKQDGYSCYSLLSIYYFKCVSIKVSIKNHMTNKVVVSNSRFLYVINKLFNIFIIPIIFSLITGYYKFSFPQDIIYCHISCFYFHMSQF